MPQEQQDLESPRHLDPLRAALTRWQRDPNPADAATIVRAASIVLRERDELARQVRRLSEELGVARAAIGNHLDPDGASEDAVEAASNGDEFAEHLLHEVQVVCTAGGVIEGVLGAITRHGVWVGGDDGEFIARSQIEAIMPLSGANGGR